MGEIILSICFSGVSLIVAVIIYLSLKKEFMEHGYLSDKEAREK